MVLSRQVTARIKEVLEKHPEGLSITDLVGSVDINRNTAGRYLENLLLSGQVEMRRFGMAKLYTLTKRLPVSSVLSLSSELVMQLDSGQRVFYANEPLLSFLGVPAKDMFGKNIEYTPFAVVFEDVFPGLLDRFGRGLKGEEWRGELSCRVRESSFFCRIAPTVSNEGTKGVTVLLEDISDQKRDEERIRKSEARLRSIFKVSPVGIGVMANRIFLEVNDLLCQMTGYSAADLVGKSVRVLYASKEEFDRVGALKYNLIQQSGTGSIETRWVKKDGKVIDVLLSSTPLDPANVSGGVTITALDITERNKAERALRESEDRYRKLVEISPDAVILHCDGKILYVNPASVRLLGAGNTEDLLGKNVLDFIQPEYRDAVRASIAKDLSGKTTPPMELQMLRVNGTPVVVEGRGVSTSINGSPAVLVAINDITHRYQAGLALKQSEERYRTLAEASQDLIFLIGRDDRVEYVNSYAAAILGLPADQVIGGKRSVLFPGELGQRQARGLARVFETGKTGHSEGAMEINGALHWFDHYLMPIMNVHGTVTSVLGVSRDITDRKAAEQALSESEERLRQITENLNSVFYVHDRTSNKFVYVSPAYEKIWKRSCQSLYDDPFTFLEAVHPDDLPLLQESIRQELEEGNYVDTEYRIIRPDGSVSWIHSHNYPVTDAGGRVYRVAGIAEDVTGRKNAEGALQESGDQYRFIADNSLDIINRLTPDCICTYVSPAITPLLGYPETEVLGNSVLTMVHPDDLGMVQRDLMKIARNGLSHLTVTFRLRHRKGHYLWFESTIKIIRDEKTGQIREFLSISRDITARKSAGQETARK